MKTKLEPTQKFTSAKLRSFFSVACGTGLLVVTVALPAATPPGPAMEMQFPEGPDSAGGNGVTTANAGALGGSAMFFQDAGNPWETNLAPLFSTNVPAGTYVPAANSFSLNVGNVIGACASGNGGRGVDLTTDFPGWGGYGAGSMGTLPKLTVCGWLNAAGYANYSDGDRIAYCMEGVGPAYQGFDLVHGQLGEIGLGINNLGSLGTRSSAEVVADPNLGTNNWVFFAAIYDPTLPANQLKYYFGRPNQLAYLDSAYTYTATNIDYTGPLTVGNYSTANAERNNTGGCSRQFRGLIDELRVYTNALTLGEIQQAQLNGTVTPVAASILTPPAKATAFGGQNPAFAVRATGSGLVTYQWKTNEVDVAGATNSSLTFVDVPLSLNGTAVRVGVSNSVGGVLSTAVTLTVIPSNPGIVYTSFSEDPGATATANLGSLAGSGALRISGGQPTFVNFSNPPSGPFGPGSAAYNKGSIALSLPDGANRAVDLTNNLISPAGELGSLDALTICGWINSANNTFRTTSTGRGNGVVSATRGGTAGGFVLSYRSSNGGLPYGQNGMLQFSVNNFEPDISNNRSSVDKIPLDTNMAVANWVFFAVTYDGTATSDNLAFYFGDANNLATNDIVQTYNKGVLPVTGTLTIGNNQSAAGNPTGRGVTGANGSAFRGLMDEIKVFSKALTLTEIQAQQVAPVLPPYLLYQTQTNNLVLSWEGVFQLQSRSTFDSGMWSNVATPTNVSGSIRSLGLPISPGSAYFRLRGQ